MNKKKYIYNIKENNIKNNRKIKIIKTNQRKKWAKI